MIRKIKKILFFSLLFIFFLFLIFGIWWTIPEEKLRISKIVCEKPLFFAQINCKGSNSCEPFLKEAIKKKISQLALPNSQKKIISLFSPFLLPHRIFLIVPAENEDFRPPRVLFVIDFEKKIKLIRLIKKQLEFRLFKNNPRCNISQGHWQIVYLNGCENNAKSANQIVSLAWVGSGILLSNHFSTLSTILKSYTNETQGATLETQNLTSANYFIVNHVDKILSPQIKKIEEKIDFELLPSVEDIEIIEGYFNPVSADKIEGKIIFYSKTAEEKNMQVLKSDVEFLKNTLRRLLKPHGVSLTGEVKENHKSVKFLFQIEGISALI